MEHSSGIMVLCCVPIMKDSPHYVSQRIDALPGPKVISANAFFTEKVVDIGAGIPPSVRRQNLKKSPSSNRKQWGVNLQSNATDRVIETAQFLVVEFIERILDIGACRQACRLFRWLWPVVVWPWFIFCVTRIRQNWFCILKAFTLLTLQGAEVARVRIDITLVLTANEPLNFLRAGRQ